MKRFLLFTSATALICFLSLTVCAADGDLDISFHLDGKVTVDVGGLLASDFGEAVAIQPDGKIVGVGSTGSNWALVRLNTNGSLDATFDGDGKVVTPIGSLTDRARDVVIQPDGKIIVVGNRELAGPAAVFVVARYNSNGSLDGTFGTGGIATTDVSGSGNNIATAVALQADGKIVVAGNANTDFGVVRYNTDGTLDGTFGTGGIVTTDLSGILGFNSAAEVQIQADGKVVVAGTTTQILDTVFGVVRYNTDGTLDGTFGTGGIATIDISLLAGDNTTGMALQSDGKIIIGGSTVPILAQQAFAVARLTQSGVLDASFGAGGITITPVGLFDTAGRLAIQADNKIVIVGSNLLDFVVIRYTADGILDPSFGSGGIVITGFGGLLDSAHGIAIQSDGKIVVFGESVIGDLISDFAFARYIVNTFDTFSVLEEGVEWGNLSVCLNCDVCLADTVITFTGHSAINGRGMRLILDETSGIAVADGGTLLLKDIVIKGVRQNNITCLDNVSTISLKDVTWVLDQDYTFSIGHFDVVSDFNVVGNTYNFTYQSPVQSTIGECGKMKLDRGVTFIYDPTTSDRNLLSLTHETSQLLLHGATLQSTPTGLQLLKGKLIVDKKSFLASSATTQSEGIMFGDGVDAENNLSVVIEPAATLDVQSGFLVQVDA